MANFKQNLILAHSEYDYKLYVYVYMKLFDYIILSLIKIISKDKDNSKLRLKCKSVKGHLFIQSKKTTYRTSLRGLE